MRGCLILPSRLLASVITLRPAELLVNVFRDKKRRAPAIPVRHGEGFRRSGASQRETRTAQKAAPRARRSAAG